MDNKEVGRRLRERRVQLGLTQEVLAETLSVGPNTISRWETGERSIAITDLPRVASALCIPPAYFFPTTPHEERSETDIRLTPVFDELRLCASRGFLTPELAEDVLDFIRFKSQQAARGRRKNDRNAP